MLNFLLGTFITLDIVFFTCEVLRLGVWFDYFGCLLLLLFFEMLRLVFVMVWKSLLCYRKERKCYRSVLQPISLHYRNEIGWFISGYLSLFWNYVFYRKKGFWFLSQGMGFLLFLGSNLSFILIYIFIMFNNNTIIIVSLSTTLFYFFPWFVVCPVLFDSFFSKTNIQVII